MNAGRSPGLLAGAIALGVAILGVITWGRARNVTVPRPLRWPDDHGPVRVATTDRRLVDPLTEALALLREHGHAVRLAQFDELVDVVVVVDPTLDGRDSVTDGAFVHGRTSLVHADGLIRSATVRVLPRSGVVVLAHELAHALGYQHPLAAPTGHLLHPSAPGLRDWRGLDGDKGER